MLYNGSLKHLNCRKMATDIRPPKANRQKVMLKPGFHLVDWMKLTQVSTDMRPSGPLRKISAAELAEHKSQFDCWTAYKGKVYNITQYAAYHPGGVPQLMSGAGKDCTVQFNKFHAWVNADSMLSKCLLGVLMTEEDTIVEEEEEEDEDENQTGKMEQIVSVTTIKIGTLALDIPADIESTKSISIKSLSESAVPSPESVFPSFPSEKKIQDIAAALNDLEIDDINS